MPAILLDFTAVEARLRSIRRRLNSVRLQHTMYVCGSLAAFNAALLVILALQSQGRTFAIALWCASGVAGAAIVASFISLYRSWISTVRAAQIADQRCALDDRLTTLLTRHQALSVPASATLDGQPDGRRRMQELLLEQVAVLAPQWKIKSVVPRRIPHSVFLFLLALSTLAATIFFEQEEPTPLARFVAVPGGGNGAAEEVQGAIVEARQGSAPIKAREASERSDAVASAPLPADGAGAPSRDGRADEGDREHSQESSPASSGDAADGHRPRNQDQSDRVSSQVQQMIRQAFGAKPLAPPRALDQSGSQDSHATKDRPGASEGDRANPTGDNRAIGGKTGEARKNGSKPEPNRQPNPNEEQQNGPPAVARSGSGSGHASGGETGPRGGDLFAQRPSQKPAAHEPKTFSLKLTALTPGLRTAMEPQIQQRPGKVADAGPVSSTRHPAQLTADDVEDSALRRPEIPPSHEAIVRRIFSARAVDLP